MEKVTAALRMESVAYRGVRRMEIAAKRRSQPRAACRNQNHHAETSRAEAQRGSRNQSEEVKRRKGKGMTG
jgi:hypothetical protein